MDKQFCLQKMREQISLVRRTPDHFSYALGFLSALYCAEVITETERDDFQAELLGCRVNHSQLRLYKLTERK